MTDLGIKMQIFQMYFFQGAGLSSYSCYLKARNCDVYKESLLASETLVPFALLAWFLT